MAHGFRCTECDCQEAEHQYNDGGYACGLYKSPDPKAEAQLWKQESAYDRSGDSDLTMEQLQAKYRIPGIMVWRT